MAQEHVERWFHCGCKLEFGIKLKQCLPIWHSGVLSKSRDVLLALVVFVMTSLLSWDLSGSGKRVITARVLVMTRWTERFGLCFRWYPDSHYFGPRCEVVKVVVALLPYGVM